MVEVPIPKKGIDGIEDPDACRVGIGKENEMVTLVAGGMGGGGLVVGISS